MRSEGSGSNRARWGVGGLAVVLFIVVGAWLGARDEPDSAPLITFTPVSEASMRPATLPSTPAPHKPRPPSTPVEPGPATPAASPGATPTTPAMRGVPPDACADGCLLRVPNNDATSAILDEVGLRPSHATGEWCWVVASREVAARLVETVDQVFLVNDSPQTLSLYATRFPDGMEESAALDTFGDVLDAVDGHRIIEVATVPPVVDAIVAERIWIEKVRPATVSAVGRTPASRPALADIDIGALVPEVDPDAMLDTITELQATSSSDGTGVGTRQYSQPGNVMATEYLFGRLESYGLEVWYEDFITWDGYLVSNVVAEIPGRDESMIYGVMAHLDSTAESFAEAPGADDNATGVAGALEIARILAGYELEHPVHIIFVNAEETAIIGSMAYAANVVEEGIPLEGVFNMDTIGNATYGSRLIVNSGPRSSWMTDLLVRINDGYGLGQEIWARQNDAIVADDNMLRNQGIEAVLVARLMADDYTVHHTSADTLENLSMDNTVSATMLVLLSIAALCQ